MDSNGLPTHDGFVRTRDGRELYLERRGEGAPAVVFEAGMGASRSSWGAVVPAVAAKTSTVAYDRSGLGRSPHDSAPRDLARLVDDLVDVIDQLGTEPLVLVGHSWGGPIVRCATDARPDRVAGLVLVDQTDEGCDMYFAAGSDRRNEFFVRIAPLMGRLGLVRWYVKRLSVSLPEPAAHTFREEDGTIEAVRAQQAEAIGSINDLRRLRDDPPPAPDIPVTLISGSKLSRFGSAQRRALIAAHQARADALPQGRHVSAAGSAHMVPFTEPELVVREIERILDLVHEAR